MKQDLIFIGYRTFKSKNGNDCYVLDFLENPHKTQNGNVVASNISVFTEPTKFGNFIKANELLKTVSVPFEISGDKVHYII